jgi:hypothetical protein
VIAPMRARMLQAIAIAAIVVTSGPCIASAQSRDRARALASPTSGLGHDPSQFALDITVVTTLPIVVGGAVALEVPGHVVLRFVGGAVPNAYVDAINDVATSWGAYGDDDAAIASTLLAGATFLEFALGIRPAGTPGIELSLGYAMLWSHHTAGMSLVGGSGDRVLGLDMSIDALHGEIAWQTELVDHFYFRLAIGWAHAIAHRVSITTEAPDEAMRATLSQAESALADAVGRHAFGPTLTGALGARF